MYVSFQVDEVDEVYLPKQVSAAFVYNNHTGHFSVGVYFLSSLPLPATSPMVNRPITNPINKPARTFFIKKPMARPINTNVQIPIVRLVCMVCLFLFRVTKGL